MEQCLLSVNKALPPGETEIIVVDNYSSDDSFTYLQNKFPQVTFLWNKENAGFARANNMALKQATGKYILFLNPDTLVPEDCLEKCTTFIKEKNDQCALGIRMIDGSGKFLKESKRAFPGPLTSLYKLTGLAHLFPKSKTFGQYHLGNLNEHQNHEVDVLAGAFMMIPRKILTEVNGFDEQFFMYGEDIDLSYRIQQAGYKNFYFADSTIIHFKGESTRKGSLNYVRMFYKAMRIFVKKHYGGPQAGFFHFLIQGAILGRAALAAASRFLKWIGLPVIDALLIFTSFGIVQIIWGEFIRHETNYSPYTLWIAFPLFTLLFLVSSYYSGLYDQGYKQSRLNKSTGVSALVILSVFVFVPLSLRFSRGILLFGILLAYLLMTGVRMLLVSWKIIEPSDSENIAHQTLIAGTITEYESALQLLKNSGTSENILGRIAPEKEDQAKVIGHWNDLRSVWSWVSVKELICCTGTLTYKEIIQKLPEVPAGVLVSFYSPLSHSIISSEDKNTAGAIISHQEYFRLGNPLFLRVKRLFDVVVSVILFLTFPVHFILKRRPIQFFKNLIQVLVAGKTFVGYATSNNPLPPLKPGLVTTLGPTVTLPDLPEHSAFQADNLYARNYQVFMDMQLVWKNYQSLS